MPQNEMFFSNKIKNVAHPDKNRYRITPLSFYNGHLSTTVAVVEKFDCTVVETLNAVY